MILRSGIAAADEKGIATWHIFSHNAGVVELYVYNSDTVSEPFTCIMNSRIKKFHGALNVERAGKYYFLFSKLALSPS